MAKASLMIAENNPVLRGILQEFLEGHDYNVIPASNSEDAKRILDEGKVDLAILDIRLTNDDDEKDMSGLELAKNNGKDIPKIIQTMFPTYEAVRDALGTTLDGLPAVVDFVAKQEGPEALLSAIRKILKFNLLESQETIDRISEELQDDYDEIRRSAWTQNWISFGLAFVGVLIIVVGIGFALKGIITYGLTCAIGGIMIEVASVLFIRRAAVARKRMENLQEKLLWFRQLEALLAECQGYSTPDEQERCWGHIITIIKPTIEQWPIDSSRGLNRSA